MVNRIQFLYLTKILERSELHKEVSKLKEVDIPRLQEENNEKGAQLSTQQQLVQSILN